MTALSTTFPASLRSFVDGQRWTFAKSMPDWPHEYIVRDSADAASFEALVVHIRTHGYEGRFYDVPSSTTRMQDSCTGPWVRRLTKRRSSTDVRLRTPTSTVYSMGLFRRCIGPMSVGGWV